MISSTPSFCFFKVQKSDAQSVFEIFFFFLMCICFSPQKELCNMILDCCAQQRTYEKFFGLLAGVSMSFPLSLLSCVHVIFLFSFVLFYCFVFYCRFIFKLFIGLFVLILFLINVFIDSNMMQRSIILS